VDKTAEKQLLWRPSRRLEDNTKTHVTETGYEDVDWIKVAKDHVQWLVFMVVTESWGCYQQVK